MSAPRDSLIEMLTNMEYGPFGDLVRQNGTLQVYWSTVQWVDPPAALEECPEDFVKLGTEGWWADQEQKAIFEKVRQWSGDLWPEWPGEWSRLDEIGWDWQI